MRHVLRTVLALGLLMVAAAPAMADWDGHPNTKWIQMPDLTVNGIDVLATEPKMLADDWQCQSPLPVTDIHIWGSWLNDQKPQVLGTFLISIWSDQPAVDQEHSRPLAQLREWQFDASSNFTERLYHTVEDPGEWWYDPNTEESFPGADKEVWQYNFYLDQPWDQVQGTIYWLGVQYVPGDGGNELFGWKTRTSPDQIDEHFNDDAVWGDRPDPGIPPVWNELRYPAGHPFFDSDPVLGSMDMAFVIMPEPGTVVLLGTGVVGLLFCLWRRRRRR